MIDSFWRLHFHTKDKQGVPGTAALTVKGQVAKERCQKVHGVHDKNGEVGHLLHLLLCWTEIRDLKVTPATFCTDMLSSITGSRRSDSLAELGVNGQDFRVANKSKSQDGDGVCCL